MKPLLPLVAALFLFHPPLIAAEPEAVFEDRFEGKPAKGWTWLRENPDAWRIKEKALEIRVEPGVARNVQNALVR